jgi:K+-transporting ATPase ATPase C chain
MRRQLVPALVLFLALTVLTGVAYPLAVTGFAQVAFPGRANGSIAHRDGTAVGSRQLGQTFTGANYFQPRPSAAGDGYDGAASSASNLGPTNPELLDEVRERIAAYRTLNGLPAGVQVPVDAVTASGSGLDPDISPANARLQAPRVARARGIPLDTVLELVHEHTDGRSLGFLGEPGVNVLELNLALDAAGS